MNTPLPAARIAALFLAGGLLAGTLPVEAAIMMYTDRAAFTAASTGLTILDFEGVGSGR
ncbi:MAG: hypothetical protein KKG92_03860 [Gammaproteobacteria bacterium]|nr:hypothetical protein [Gammaproteobacteria bacterium]